MSGLWCCLQPQPRSSKHPRGRAELVGAAAQRRGLRASAGYKALIQRGQSHGRPACAKGTKPPLRQGPSSQSGDMARGVASGSAQPLAAADR